MFSVRDQQYMAMLDLLWDKQVTSEQRDAAQEILVDIASRAGSARFAGGWGRVLAATARDKGESREEAAAGVDRSVASVGSQLHAEGVRRLKETGLPANVLSQLDQQLDVFINGEAPGQAKVAQK